jgi:hypothetical protein
MIAGWFGIFVGGLSMRSSQDRNNRVRSLRPRRRGQTHFASVLVSAVLILSLMWVVSTKDAHAYLDPGTGSFLLQIMLASLFASMFALKVFWQRFTGRLSRILAFFKGQKDTPDSEQ